MEGFGTNVINLPALSLALIMLIVAVLAELRVKKINRFGLPLFGPSVLAFFICSFFLQPVGEISDAYAILSYFAVVLQLAVIEVSFFPSGIRLINTLVIFILSVFLPTLGSFVFALSGGNNSNKTSMEDAAVVLGLSVLGPHEPTPVLQGRLDAALNVCRRTCKKSSCHRTRAVAYRSVVS